MILLNCHWFCQGDVGLDSSAPRPSGGVMSTIFKCMSVFLLILSQLWLLGCLLIFNYIIETFLKTFHWKLTIFICISKSILNGYPIHRFSLVLISSCHLSTYSGKAHKDGAADSIIYWLSRRYYHTSEKNQLWNVIYHLIELLQFIMTIQFTTLMAGNM